MRPVGQTLLTAECFALRATKHVNMNIRKLCLNENETHNPIRLHHLHIPRTTHLATERAAFHLSQNAFAGHPIVGPISAGNFAVTSPISSKSNACGCGLYF